MGLFPVSNNNTRIVPILVCPEKKNPAVVESYCTKSVDMQRQQLVVTNLFTTSFRYTRAFADTSSQLIESGFGCYLHRAISESYMADDTVEIYVFSLSKEA